MLEICNTFTESNHIYFNTKKTINIKFGVEKSSKKFYSKRKKLTWADHVILVTLFAMLMQMHDIFVFCLITMLYLIYASKLKHLI